ncbi:MAG TPA: hypothetical protein VK914_12410 [bacterium]|nr:hypothetical protein [bacterium]
MKKEFLALALVIACGTGSLAADTTTDSTTSTTTDSTTSTTTDAALGVPPQLHLNLDALAGVRTTPSGEAGHGIGGGSAGFEYIPAYFQYVGVDLDYGYLAVGKPTTRRDNDIDLSLRLMSPTMGSMTGWLQAGAGYNTSPNEVNSHYLAFIEPGFRWVILPRLALDSGVEFIQASPKADYVRSVSVVMGLSIPLDGDYLSGK